MYLFERLHMFTFRQRTELMEKKTGFFGKNTTSVYQIYDRPSIFAKPTKC